MLIERFADVKPNCQMREPDQSLAKSGLGILQASRQGWKIFFAHSFWQTS